MPMLLDRSLWLGSIRAFPFHQSAAVAVLPHTPLEAAATATLLNQQPLVCLKINSLEFEMKNVFLGALGVIALPLGMAHAQSMFESRPSVAGAYIGVEGGLNWLLNNNNYNMDLGYGVGGVVGYDFVGPRVELEGVFRSNNGAGTANFGNVFTNTAGRLQQLSFMANGLYDFLPGATLTPYVGAGMGLALADPALQGCSLCSTQFAYQGIVGVGYNASPTVRVNLDGRYYGTTNPGTYSNNDISLMLGVTFKFGGKQPAR
jgi:OOP family OmpA-OmpF porin